jgi:hypothetical protein
LIDRSDKQMVAQLDDHLYNESELIEIKVALHLPYLSNQENYIRYDGEIEIDGIQYNYVKRKIQHDTLFLKCLPNITKTKLYAERSYYGNHVNDTPVEKKGHAVPKKKGLSLDHNAQVVSRFDFAVSTSYFKAEYCSFVPLLQDPFLASDCQPPDCIA